MELKVDKTGEDSIVTMEDDGCSTLPSKFPLSLKGEIVESGATLFPSACSSGLVRLVAPTIGLLLQAISGFFRAADIVARVWIRLPNLDFIEGQHRER